VQIVALDQTRDLRPLSGSVCKNYFLFLILRSRVRFVLKYSEYSMNPKKATHGNKSFSFCEQTMQEGLVDASCNWLQSTLVTRGQNNFLRKFRAKI
jgi:hypothetical protein